MSLYTPVFPPTDQPPLDATPSSSLSSTSTGARRSQGLPYSSRLSHWHLSIAALPEELYPASEPPSPASKERAAKLQTTIEEAVREGRYVGDHYNLRSTRLGYATRQPVSSYDGASIPYILPDTEEEWFEWERRVAEQRANSKGKQRENVKFAPPKSKAVSSRDKVIGWKSGLEAPSKSDLATLSSQPSETQQTTLGFPVVKRASVLKTTKVNIPVSVAPQSNANEATPTPHPQPPVANDIQNNALNDQISTDTAASPKCPADDPSLPLSIPRNDTQRDLALQIVQAQHGGPLESFEASICPPPSFPSQLPTSTPKKNVPPAHNLAQQGELELRPQNDELAIPETAELSQSSPRQIPNIATPPSPPPSSKDSPVPISRNVKQAAPLDAATAPPQLPLADNKHMRPLTPPPEDGALFRAASQTTPRTPEKQPMKRYRTMSSLTRPIDGPSTPLSSVNGGGIVRGLWGAPTTPDQHAVVDLLATSRKSIPRPRPPSRKDRKHEVDPDPEAVSDAGDPSPAKSERSYFSSPASGDSSGSIISAHLPGSPTSPLNFTQNPDKFAPIGQSTQASPLAKHQSKSRLACLQTQPGSSQTSIAGGGFHRASSGLMGMVYNSQFDLDSRVNQVSNFLEKDVDFGAWVRDDDDDDEALRVEELTKSVSFD